MKLFLKNLALSASVLMFGTVLFAQEQQPSQQPQTTQQSTQSAPQETMPPQPYQQQGNESGIETLFGEKAPFVLVPTFKATPAGSSWGTMLGVYGGAQVNKSLLVGFGTYWSFSHQRMNMGYSGVLAEYRYMPHRLIHVGGSLLVGYGSAEATNFSPIRPLGIFENIGRLFTPQFFVVEPSAFGEINLNPNLAASLGASYRLVTGLQESLSTSYVVPTNQNLSGLSVNVGMRFRFE
ncbi:MAG: hypothetical protein MUF71_04940 [Candidatus Kapabacteria bacterium]|jgi:hypothetical protein|nr:hypothetical protein [Candidatus Kapabacteria bacterium]